MSNKYHTYCTFRNKAAGNRAAAAYRKQMGLGLDGKPRRYGKQKKAKAPNTVLYNHSADKTLNDKINEVD